VPLGDGRGPVQGHLAHRRGIGEDPALAAYLPDALVWLPPGIPGHVGQLGQRRPQRRLELPAAAGPLVRAVEYLAVDIMLALVGRAVAPSHRGGTPVAFELGILPFVGHRAAVEVVHDPRLPALLEGVQHPAQERVGLGAEADPAQGEHGEGRVANPGVAVIPVPHPADRRGQRGRRRGDQRAVDPVVAQLQGDRRPPDQRFLETLVAEVRHPLAPRRGGARQHGPGVETMMAMGAAPGQHDVQGIALPEVIRSVQATQRAAGPQVELKVRPPRRVQPQATGGHPRLGTAARFQLNPEPHAPVQDHRRPDQLTPAPRNIIGQVSTGT
jgi:hypothetical protein